MFHSDHNERRSFVASNNFESSWGEDHCVVTNPPATSHLLAIPFARGTYVIRCVQGVACLLESHGIGAVRVCLGGLQLYGLEFGGLLALSATEGQLTDSKFNVDAAAHNPLKKSKIERAMPPAVEPVPSRSAFHAELGCSTERLAVLREVVVDRSSNFGCNSANSSPPPAQAGPTELTSKYGAY